MMRLLSRRSCDIVVPSCCMRRDVPSHHDHHDHHLHYYHRGHRVLVKPSCHRVLLFPRVVVASSILRCFFTSCVWVCVVDCCVQYTFVRTIQLLKYRPDIILNNLFLFFIHGCCDMLSFRQYHPAYCTSVVSSSSSLFVKG